MCESQIAMVVEGVMATVFVGYASLDGAFVKLRAVLGSSGFRGVLCNFVASGGLQVACVQSAYSPLATRNIVNPLNSQRAQFC